MATRLITILTFLVLTITISCGQNYEPLELAKKIFSKDSFTNIDKFITGEYKGRPNGQDLQKGSTTRFLLLGQTDKRAVIAMTILDSTGKGLDTYLHFEKDSTWKMNAFRALAMTGILEQAKNELEKLTPQQVDDIIKTSKQNKKGKEYSIFSSKEDYYFQLGNVKLTLELDSNIIQHLLNNKTEFEKIKNLVLKELGNKPIDEERDMKVGETLKQDYQKLFISSISIGGYEFGNCLNFLIGGMVDNSVGYIYVKDKKDLPEMSPDRIIMLREIGDGWYIYKTT